MIQLTEMTEQECHLLADWNRGRDAAYLCQWAGPAVYQAPLTEEQVLGRLRQPGVRLFLAWEDGEPVGSVELDRSGQSPGSAHICRFLLPEAVQGRGLGGQILRALCRMAWEELGLDRLTLRVYCFNVGAIRCYEGCGFRVREFHPAEKTGWDSYTMELKR